MSARKPIVQKAAWFTPLGIIATFLGLTELAVATSTTQVSGVVQFMLASFAVLFPFFVATLFFLILWKKAYVLYSPSEYGDKNFELFIKALTPIIPADIIENIRQIEQEPDDLTARYKLVNAFISEHARQTVILMHEKKTAVSGYLVSLSFQSFSKRGWNSASFSKGSLFSEMHRADLAVALPSHDDFTSVDFELSTFGQGFAIWLLASDMKAEYVEYTLGKWGAIPEGQRAPFAISSRD